MKKIKAFHKERNETEIFTELAWRIMPKGKYGWQEIKEPPKKKPEPLKPDEPKKAAGNKKAAESKKTKK